MVPPCYWGMQLQIPRRLIMVNCEDLKTSVCLVYFPHLHCVFFCERGGCERHRCLSLGKRICIATNSWCLLYSFSHKLWWKPKTTKLVVADHSESFARIASYSISQSTGVSGTLIFLRFDSYRQHCVHYSASEPNASWRLNRKLSMQTT